MEGTYRRDDQSRYATLLSALRANRLCINERKQFNMIRATTIGQVEPQTAKDAAIQLIDCQSRVNSIPKLTDIRKRAIQCLKTKRNCQSDVNNYINVE